MQGFMVLCDKRASCSMVAVAYAIDAFFWGGGRVYSTMTKNKLKAERRGFEPRIPFGGIHAFQACLLSHSSIFPSKKNNL